MAISYVGGVTSGRAGSTSTTTQSLSGTLTGGTDTSPSAGDLVVVLCASGADTTAAPSQDISGNNSGAYTGLTAQSSVVATTYDTYSRVSYIIQGSTVDTSITIPSSGSARNAQRWVVHVFRGVDSTTPMDVTATYATGTGTGRPNPALIAPTTAGAWIAAFYASAAATGAAYTAPTDFATDWLGGTTADTADVMTGAGYYTGWTSGNYDPAAITAGGTTNAADSWTATTIALRPADLTAPTVALNSPADASSGSDTTPDLSFTGTDTEGKDIRYNVQVDTVNTFDSNVPYSQTLAGFSNTISGGTGTSSETNQAYGQTIIPGSNFSVVSVDVMLKVASGTPTDNVYVSIYSGSETGTLLGTSALLSGSSISTVTPTVYNFAFTSPISLTSGVTYYLTVQRTGTTYDISNNYRIYYTNTDPISGNVRIRSNNAWADSTTLDLYLVLYGPPAINAVSGTDPGFSGSPDNTDPFASGQQVTYTVQAGDALAVDTYYWRVRGIDPSGSNTYGAWSSTRSFEITSGAPVNGAVTQVAQAMTLTGGTQAVVGNVLQNGTVSQVAASLALTGGTQSVATVNNSAITQVAGSLALSGGTQTVSATAIVSASITQVSASLALTGGTQAVSASAIVNASVAQVSASLALSGGTQTVASVQNGAVAQVAATVSVTGQTQVVAASQNVAISQVAGTVTTTGGTQSVSTSAVVNASVTQLAASIAIIGGTQVVASVQNTTVSQVAGSLTISGGTQAISTSNYATVSQVSSTLALTGGTQTVATTRFVAISQLAASLSLAGGTQTITTVGNVAITQASAPINLIGGTQTVASSQVVNVAQVAATVSLAGGTQIVEGGSTVSAAIDQVSAAMVLIGGTQAVTSSQQVSIAQAVAALTVSGGTQVITSVNNAAISQVSASVTISTGTAVITAVRSANIAHVAANLALSGGTQSITAVVIASVAISQVSKSVTISGGTQAVNAQISTSVAQVSKNLALTGGIQAITAIIAPVSINILQVAAMLAVTGNDNQFTLKNVVIVIPSDDVIIRTVEDTLLIKSYEDSITIKEMPQDNITITTIEDLIQVKTVDDSVLIKA